MEAAVGDIYTYTLRRMGGGGEKEQRSFGRVFLMDCALLQQYREGEEERSFLPSSKSINDISDIALLFPVRSPRPRPFCPNQYIFGYRIFLRSLARPIDLSVDR